MIPRKQYRVIAHEAAFTTNQHDGICTTDLQGISIPDVVEQCFLWRVRRVVGLDNGVTLLGPILTSMVLIAPQAESETTANSDDSQSPVLPPSDVEEVIKTEIKELRSLYSSTRHDTGLTPILQVAFPYLLSPEKSGRTCGSFGSARCGSETTSRWSLCCSPAMAGERISCGSAPRRLL